MTVEIIALVPVREGSQRVKGKNFIPFAGDKSLLELKIEQLKQADCFEHIYVSSDSEQARRVALDNGIEFLLRETEMCQGDVIWADAVKHIMETIPGSPVVTWALVTSPLFQRYNDAVSRFSEVQDQHDSLVSVLPKRSFFLNKHGRGINYNPGYWHPHSQELETYYEVTGACYIGLKSDMVRWKYWFGIRPYLFEVSAAESVDVDTPKDFEFAQLAFDTLKT